MSHLSASLRSSLKYLLTLVSKYLLWWLSKLRDEEQMDCVADVDNPFFSRLFIRKAAASLSKFIYFGTSSSTSISSSASMSSLFVSSNISGIADSMRISSPSLSDWSTDPYNDLWCCLQWRSNAKAFFALKTHSFIPHVKLGNDMCMYFKWYTNERSLACVTSQT